MSEHDNKIDLQINKILKLLDISNETNLVKKLESIKQEIKSIFHDPRLHDSDSSQLKYLLIDIEIFVSSKLLTLDRLNNIKKSLSGTKNIENSLSGTNNNNNLQIIPEHHLEALYTYPSVRHASVLDELKNVLNILKIKKKYEDRKQDE